MLILRRRFLSFNLFIFFLIPFGEGYAQSYFATIADITIGFYQKAISPVRQSASSCQFTPSCSEYAKEAIEQYGFVTGSLLGADRLMRCGGHEPNGYPFNGKRWVDPPSKNHLFGSGNLWKVGNSNLRTLSDSIEAVTLNLRFAYSLFREQEYDYSIIELKRLQSNTENKEDRNYANVLIAINYLSNKSIKKARASIDHADRSQLDLNLNKNSFLVDYLIADAEDLDAWNASRCKQEISSATPLPLPLPAMQTYSLTKGGEYEKAKNNINSNAQLYESIKQVEMSDHKSPLLAGIMSTVLPGSGYIYNGRFSEGLSALTINALLGWGIYSLFKNHNTGSGLLLSSIALPFYFGNIIGSANASMSENNKMREVSLAMLRHDLELDFYFSFNFFSKCWQK
jgi:putative component of membrane protein insertase Oxa1/YidC/SpoIIIJ protein YidD